MNTLSLNQMAVSMSGYSKENLACDIAMGAAGAIWTAAVGACTGPIGGGLFSVIVWAPFQGWVCSHA